MKATRTLANLACLLGIGLLVLLVLPNAAQAATCFFVHPPADGRILGPYTLTSATDDINLAFAVETGRSYSVEMTIAQGPAITSEIEIHMDNTFCPTTDIVSGISIRDTTSITPEIGAGKRRSLVVTTAPPGLLAVRLHNLGLSPTQYVVSVTETTLFSPGWATFAGLQTFWSFLNTTKATINGTITLLDGFGTQVAALGVGILPGRAVFPSTITLGIAANRSGTARFTHDGPPGAVLAEAAITNGTYFQRVRFEPRQR